jgi:hypothetical protein
MQYQKHEPFNLLVIFYALAAVQTYLPFVYARLEFERPARVVPSIRMRSNLQVRRMKKESKKITHPEFWAVYPDVCVLLVIIVQLRRFLLNFLLEVFPSYAYLVGFLVAFTAL